MSDPLLEIKKYLVSKGITQDIVLDGFESEELSMGITLVRDASRPEEFNNPLKYLNFTVYIKSSLNKNSYEVAASIRDILKDQGGKLGNDDSIVFYPIEVVSSPYKWGKDIWVCKFGCQYSVK